MTRTSVTASIVAIALLIGPVHSFAQSGGAGSIMFRDDMKAIEHDSFLYEPFLHARILGEKDLSLALALGDAVSVKLPLAQLAYQGLASGLGVPHTEKEA